MCEVYLIFARSKKEAEAVAVELGYPKPIPTKKFFKLKRPIPFWVDRLTFKLFKRLAFTTRTRTAVRDNGLRVKEKMNSLRDDRTPYTIYSRVLPGYEHRSIARMDVYLDPVLVPEILSFAVTEVWKPTALDPNTYHCVRSKSWQKGRVIKIGEPQ